MNRASSRETALSAVAGRLAFVAALAVLIYALAFHLPRVFQSSHVAHFAGFYLFALACAAAAKRVPIITLGAYIAAFAAALEAVRTAAVLPLEATYLDAVADLAGLVAALAPMLLQKIRAAFRDPATHDANGV